MSALSKQVGGTHYKKYPIQPMEFAAIFNLNMPQGLVLKYITRHQDKAKKEDLEKAIHVCELAQELQFPQNRVTDTMREFTSAFQQQSITKYCIMLYDNCNLVSAELYVSLIYSILDSKWKDAIIYIQHIKTLIYGD